MGWNQIVGEVRQQLPQFNNNLLIDYHKQQINSAPEFMDVVFRESVRSLAVKVPVEYVGYRIVQPQQQVQYLLGSAISKDKVNIKRSELQLVEYDFMFEETKIPVYLYLPYLYNNVITIDDTQYAVLNSIIDKFIVRTADEIIMHVMKLVIKFWRNKKYSFKDVDGNEFHEVLVTVVAIHSPKKTSLEMTIVLYLMAEYGFREAMRRLSADLSFVDHAVANDETSAYFLIVDGMYLKASRSQLSSVSYRRTIASILYAVCNFKDCIASIADLYSEELYKTILGKIWHGRDYKSALAADHCENHLESAKSFLDAITARRLFDEKHIVCNDIFDLFTYVFFNIDDWLVGYAPNDLFEKRLGGIESLMENEVSQINNKFYKSIARYKQMRLKEVDKTLKFNPMMIRSIHKLNCVQANPSSYNDNILFSILIQKKRPISGNKRSSKGANTIQSKEHQFSPTFLAIESVWSISSSAPGVSGDINPFAVVDSNGKFLKDEMPWYKDIEDIQKYIAQT